MKDQNRIHPTPRLFQLAALVGLGFGCFSTAHAQQFAISTADGNGADTYISNDTNKAPTLPLGGETTINFRHIPDSRFKALYFRFDISGYSDFSNAQISLNGTTVNRNRGMLFFGLVDGSVEGLGENWDEASLSYSNAAGFAAATDGNFSTTSELTATAVASTSGSVVGPNVTGLSAALDDFLNADTNGIVTFTMFSTNPWNQSEDFFFSSKEGAGGPILTFDAVAVPEPSAFALFAGLGALLIGLRRRR